MLLKPKTIIGMETTPAKVKMVEMDNSSRPVKVLNFAAVDLPAEHEEERGALIRETLIEKGFSASRVSIALAGPLLYHRLMTLPPMSKAELRTVAKREIGKESKIPPSDLSFDVWPMGEVDEGGIKKKEVTAVAASTEEVNGIVALAREAELEPQVLSTSSLSLVNALKLTEERTKGELTGIAYLGIESSIVVIVEGWSLRFSREFTLGLERGGIDSPEAEIDIPQRVSTELNRSFLYYKQHFRKRQPERIILAGEIGDLEKTRSFLQSELRAEVEVYDPSGNLDLSPLKEREGEFLGDLPSFAVPLGSAWKGPREIEINLLPAEYVERKHLVATKVAMVTATALFLVFLVAGYLGLSKSLGHYEAILQHERENWNSLERETSQLLQAKRDRALHESRMSLIGGQASGSSLWKGRLRALSLLVPDEMVFSSFSATKEDGGILVDIQGSVVAEDAARSQAVFNRFYSLLEDSVLVKRIEPPEIRLKPFDKSGKRDQPVSEAMEEGGQILSEVSFAIACEFWPDYL